MRLQRIDAFASAVNEIQDAFRQSRFLEQFDNEHDSQRNFFARLQDKGVPARQRQREHPHRNHRREIERRDPDTNAERLQQRLAIDAPRQIFERITEKQRRDAAGVLDVLDPAISTAARLGERLAMFARYALANPIEVFFDELPITKENSRTW